LWQRLLFYLQPGNGSTDLILGVFWQRSTLGSDWSWFSQAAMQASIDAESNFRPGNKLNFDGGARYVLNQNMSVLLQLNLQWNATDSRADAALTEALKPSSGGTTLSLTPGLSYAVTRSTQVYGLLQLPLYQYVKGEQLTADSSITVGVNHRF